MAESPRRLQDSEEIGSRRSKKDKFYEFLEDHFFWLLIGIACTGMVLAFTVPLWVCSFSKEDSVSALRQAILAATGGTLAIFTLLETHQKNIREKEKNEQDHIRQVHAERRSRYAKAVEQLADEKAPIRLGGVYTLTKLVDDWLNDEKTLPSEGERRQEGQIIVNSLCAYIRSSFPLAERHEEFSSDYEDYKKKCQNNKIKIYIPQSYKNSIKVFSFGHKKSKYNNQPIQSREEFARNKLLFREEQEVRKKILLEIKKRLNGGIVKNKDGRDEIKPGTWSYFEYDFSNAVFFYDVEFNEVNFSGKKTDFSETEFIHNADFSDSTFCQGHKVTRFSGAHFHKDVDFSKAIFNNQVSFFDVKFIEETNFFMVIFAKSAFFSKADFRRSAYFFLATFIEGAEFSEVIFNRTAYFYGATFNRGAYFFMANFQFKPIFESAFGDKIYKAKFSNWVDPEDYDLYGSDINWEDFFVDPDSLYKIETEKHRSPDGTITTIPKGCIVFNPSLTKISISDDSIKGISVKGVSANGVPQVQEKLEMSPWPKRADQIQSINP